MEFQNFLKEYFNLLKKFPNLLKEFLRFPEEKVVNRWEIRLKSLKKPKKEIKMAKNQNVRLAPVKLQVDLDSYTAWLGITTYAPANTAYAKTAVTAKYTALKAAHTA